jgi:hypothetical protein
LKGFSIKSVSRSVTAMRRSACTATDTKVGIIRGLGWGNDISLANIVTVLSNNSMLSRGTDGCTSDES